MRKIILFIVGMCVLAVTAYANIKVPGIYGSDESDAALVLILTETTRYKLRLVEALVEELSSENVRVELHAIKALDRIDTANYSSILIVDSWKERVKPRVQNWLSEHAEEKILLLITKTHLEDRRERVVVPVDSITTASRTSNIPEMLSRILPHIDAFR